MPYRSAIPNAKTKEDLEKEREKQRIYQHMFDMQMRGFKYKIHGKCEKVLREGA